ncbi:MAG: alpha/beta hydrolase [Phycisphaerae bacterium]|nr:alpha/beta hydrolase [Phycisphaerae bacterium]
MRSIWIAVATALVGLYPGAVARGEEAPAAPAQSITLHVETRGTGPVQMVLVPGLSCDWTVWEAFMKRNESAYTMHALTLPGFGGTEPPPTPPEGSKFSESPWINLAERAIVELIQTKRLDRPVLVGHSLGGHLACRIAAKNPGLLQSAVAVDGMPAFPLAGPGVPMTTEQRENVAAAIYRNMTATPDEAWPEQQRTFFTQMVTDPARGEQLTAMCLKTPKRVASRYMAELLGSDVIAETKASQTPIVFFAAVAPPDVPGMTPETVKRIWAPFVDGAATLHLVYFEECRHFIMDDAPAEFDRAISQWVKGEPVEGKAATEPAPQPPDHDPSESPAKE